MSTTTGVWSLGRSFLRGGLVNDTRGHQRFEGVTDQDVVDAHAPVAAKAKVSVVPPGEAFVLLGEQSVGVVQAQCNQGAQVVALFFGAMDGVLQTHGVPHVGVVKGDVVVPINTRLGGDRSTRNRAGL